MIGNWPNTPNPYQTWKEYSQESWYAESVHGGEVSSQLASINLEGLTEEEGTSLRQLVISLGKRMGALWKPGGCQFIPPLADLANQILRASPSARRVFGELIPKRYIHTHFFWSSNCLEGAEGRQLILDPTGVPADLGNPKKSTITPYFGLLEKAPTPHIIVYRNMAEMDDWGTREFPPTFHP